STRIFDGVQEYVHNNFKWPNINLANLYEDSKIIILQIDDFNRNLHDIYNIT
ncbi:hypothetical protein KI387_008235, partial [Taxus chinensis]